MWYISRYAMAKKQIKERMTYERLLYEVSYLVGKDIRLFYKVSYSCPQHCSALSI